VDCSLLTKCSKTILAAQYLPPCKRYCECFDTRKLSSLQQTLEAARTIDMDPQANIEDELCRIEALIVKCATCSDR
jgi:hypothetical protein